MDLPPSIRTFCGGNQEVKIMEKNEIKPVLVGGFGEKKTMERSIISKDRIYDSEAIAMSQCASISNRSYNYLVYDGYNQEIRKDSDTCGTITRNVGADLKRNGQGIIEYELSDKMKKYINSYDDKYKVSDGNLVGNRDCAVSKTTREGNTRADASDYISIDFPPNTNISGVDLQNCRVRKLTEKECGKLMGVLPVDCEKIAKNQSRSSQYHLYGDSIVTTVLMAWFGEILGIDWKSKVDEVVNELTGG